MATFLSGDKQISIQQFSPDREGKHPAVLLVHGSSGPRTAVEQYAPMLTRFGYAVFIVQYFESTGTSFATPQLTQQHFLAWLGALSDAVNHVCAQPNVDAGRIGLLGVSLGAFLSLALASQDSRIAAVVDLFGGMPQHFISRARRMPPVLILHGENDSMVPVAEAQQVEALLKKLGASCECKIYPGQGTPFEAWLPGTQPSAFTNSWKRI